MYLSHVEHNQNLRKAGQVLKLFTDEEIDAETPFQAVQAQAFTILERRQLASIADQIATDARYDEAAFQWDHIDSLAHQFKRHLRPILLAVEFAAPHAHDRLLEAVQFLQAAFRQEKSLAQSPAAQIPTRCIPANLRRYLYAPDARGRKRLLPDRYEFLVYRLLRQGLESGDIFCRECVRFRSFQDDLLDDQRWQAKEALMADTGLLIDPGREATLST